jgi:peptide/nickel transport system substrate-binding protein
VSAIVCGAPRRTRGRAAVLASAVLLASLCAGAAAAAPDLSKSETLTVSLGSEVNSLDPYAFTDTRTHTVILQLFDPIIDHSPLNGEPIPRVATSVQPLGPTEWDVHLQPDAKFTNGEAVDAAAVKFSLDRALDPRHRFPLTSQFGWIKSVTVVDSRTVRIATKAPYPLVRQLLSVASVVPPQYVRSVGDDVFARQPVGNGPYKLAAWEPGRELVLVRNDDALPPKPRIKNLVFLPITETATRIAGLLSGNIDVVQDVPPDQIDAINASGVARVYATPGLRADFLVFDAFGLASKTPLMQKQVRLAIAHAINVDDIITHLLGGRVTRTCVVGSPLAFGYDKSVPCYAYDPALARRLLAEAGYPHGFQITLNMFPGLALSSREVSQAIQGDLAAVGIDARIHQYPSIGQYFGAITAHKVEGIQLSSEGGFGLFDLQAAYTAFASEHGQYSYIADPDIYGWFNGLTGTIDMAARRRLYANIHRRIHDEAYWLPLWVQQVNLAISNRARLQVSPDDALRFRLATWSK